MDYLGKGEMLTKRDVNKLAHNIWDKYPFCAYGTFLDIFYTIDLSSWKWYLLTTAVFPIVWFILGCVLRQGWATVVWKRLFYRKSHIFFLSQPSRRTRCVKGMSMWWTVVRCGPLTAPRLTGCVSWPTPVTVRLTRTSPSSVCLWTLLVRHTDIYFGGFHTKLFGAVFPLSSVHLDWCEHSIRTRQHTKQCSAVRSKTLQSDSIHTLVRFSAGENAVWTKHRKRTRSVQYYWLFDCEHLIKCTQ